MPGKGSAEDRNRHAHGGKQHHRGPAAIRALKRSEPDRHGADCAEDRDCRLVENEPDDERNRNAERAPQRSDALELAPVDEYRGPEDPPEGAAHDRGRVRLSM